MKLVKEHYKSILPSDLYREIEEICAVMKAIHQETAGLVCNSKVPDATAQLNDVLQSTETATHAILDAAEFIKKSSDESSASEQYKQQITENVLKIYEACTFQDITGQRIKKVLKHLGILDERLLRLSEMVKNYSDGQPQPQEQPADANNIVLSGPQLSDQTPSQTDVDKLFMNIK